MPALATSQSATVNITSPNGYITVTCANGDVMQVDWVSPGSVSGSRTVRQITEDVGPFVDGTVITLRAVSGSPQYTDGVSGVVGGAWRSIPSVTMRLRMAGTGTVSMDSAAGPEGAGTITTAVYTATLAGVQLDDYAYPGDNARSIRVNLTGTATCEVI